MKTLYLFRHAKSSWKDPLLMDYERPLNKRGQRDAPVMGRRLAKQNILPDLIISSPAKRAITTARIIADQIGYAIEKIIQDETLYAGNEQTILDTIKQQNDRFNSIMLFGHNPAITKLANLLISNGFEKIPTTGIVGFTINENKWGKLNFNDTKTTQLILFDYPKNVKK